MKRAKMALMAMGVAAVVSSALAIKANRLAISYCRIGTPGVCTTIFLNTSFVPTNRGNTYCTFNHGSRCTQKVITFVQP
jgi:hypothetical protein